MTSRKAPTADFEDYDYGAGRPYLCTGSWVHDGARRSSTYRHPHGIVEVDEYVSGTPITAFGFIWQGQTYRRRWEHSFGDKTIARLAREFIEDVTK